jgi:hypothetical protein
MRDGLFAAFSAAILVVTLAPRSFPPRSPALAAASDPELNVRVAWLAQRESAVGDWEAVTPPLREGDELQLTVLADADAWVYVLDGAGRQLFPPPGVSPGIQASWPYAIPGGHRTWRLDEAAHDVFFLVAARHPIADPRATLSTTLPATQATRSEPDLLLPLRDGRHGAALTRRLRTGGVAVDRFDAR